MRIPSSRCVSILSIAIGLVLALGGMGCGVYFGFMKPAIDAGVPIVIPVRTIVVISAILIFLVLIGLHLLRTTRSGRPTDDRWEGGNAD